MAQLVRQVALVSEVEITFSDLTRTSAALQKQVARDLKPIWDVEATVDPFHRLEDVPLGYWPVIIETDIGFDALGIHLDKDGQPFALVNFTEGWQLTTSHEVLEMLVDPFGNRLIAGDSPKEDQGRVEFLVEVCDPSEAVEFGYTVNGITVSDFYTPAYFDPTRAEGVRYSFTGAITEPRLVLRGGYLSWHEPVSDHWWQLVFFGSEPQFRDLGKLTQRKNESLRSMIDRLTEAESLKSMLRNKRDLQATSRAFASLVARPSESKAEVWRAQIAALKGTGAEEEGPAGAPRRRATRRGSPAAERTEEQESPPARRRRSSEESESFEFARRRVPRKGAASEE